MTRDTTTDDRFVAFGDVVRRRVLSYLSTAPDDSPEVAFDDVVSKLVADDETGLATETEAKLNLVHVHLPKLQDAKLVERDGDTIRLTVLPDVVTDGLELAEEFETA